MIDAIKKRRSIRKYKNQVVEPEKIEELLKAAMLAPTALNLQPWRFVVVRNKELLNRIPTFHPYSNMMKSADSCILVMGDRNVTKKDEYIYCDCSAAIMNMLLQASELGLGTCWCAIAPDQGRIQAFRENFDLAENLLPVAMVALGYPDEEKGEKDTFKPEYVRYIL